MNICVIGDVMLDGYTLSDIHRISPEAPVPVARVKEKKYMLGGAGNVALNISRQSEKVSLVGLVGNDDAGKKIKDLLSENRIKSYLITSSLQETIYKERIISSAQQVLRIDYETNIAHKTIQEKIFKKAKESIDKNDLIIFSDYAKNLHDIMPSLISYAVKKRKIILVDPKSNDFSKYKKATLITPNLKEFENAIGKNVGKNLNLIKKECLNLQKKFKIENILVTMGEFGMHLTTKNKKHFYLEAKAKEVYDITGAGDTVISTFASAISKGYDMFDSMKYANNAAEIVVGRIGASSCTWDEINFKNQVNNKSMDLIAKLEALRQNGKKIIFTNGCFDLVHSGHINYLNDCKRDESDILVVALNSDSSIKKLKGSERPINNLKDRINLISNLKSVNYVTDFDEITPIKLIKKIKPDIIAKGGDYKPEDIVGGTFVKSYGGEIRVLKLHKGKSTSSLIKKINKSAK